MNYQIIFSLVALVVGTGLFLAFIAANMAHNDNASGLFGMLTVLVVVGGLLVTGLWWTSRNDHAESLDAQAYFQKLHPEVPATVSSALREEYKFTWVDSNGKAHETRVYDLYGKSRHVDTSMAWEVR